MAADVVAAFEPRKMPIQTRATVRVGTICEATIQVLLSHGADRLTATRVAERAGVSVGNPVPVLSKQAVAAVCGV